MKIEVRYYSRGGNTKKVAEAIAAGAKVEAKTTDVPLTEDVDILFLGSAVYAYGVDSNIKEFIKNINVKVGKVVNFSTAAAIKSTYRHIKKLLDKKGIPMAKEEFYCRGEFGLIHKGHPNDDDLRNAKEFANNIIEK